MLLSLLALCCLSTVSTGHESCDQELAREYAEDSKLHGCRACKPLPVVAKNCPPTGFDCDVTLPMTSNVIAAGCGCAKLQCANKKATLFVGGEAAGKLHCKDMNWNSASGAASAGVCGRRCGPGICLTIPDTFFEGNDKYAPFVVNRPDATHPCSWGRCQFGAEGLNANVSYGASVEFSCTGDGKWRGPQGQRHETIMCKRKSPAPACPVYRTFHPDECASAGCTHDAPTIGSIKVTCPSPSYPCLYYIDAGNVKLHTCVMGKNALCTKKGWVDSIDGENPGAVLSETGVNDPRWGCSQ